ncbi:hypothetical protein DM02DRAFT_73776 [Periconia macrospinosa]|uniref:RRM domain-containing protein n=1 Tax=Periconia macrospinosa TaxID=97972 RepID=A0A2V1DHL8_9PLEO|nr:hypothetical protein DM02DRAFT_73776 [Periconia macrospinosa]
MLSSPPEVEDPEYTAVRANLTPESPKPLHYPSPSNIPILEKQMDPMLGEPAISIGTPASYLPQTHTPSVHSTASYYADPQSAQNIQNAAAAVAPSVGSAAAAAVAPSVGSAAAAATATYSQSSAYNGPGGAQSQQPPSSLHSTQNYSIQQPQSSYRDAQSAPAQDTRSAYPYAHDANAYTSHAQTASNIPSVDVQALLDQLSSPSNNAAQFAASPMPHESAQSHGNSPTTSLPAAANLPPRPPPQEKGATNPNYNPNDDIRSYHPHSGHRASSQLPPATNTGNAGDQHTRSNQSPSASSFPQRQAGEQERTEDQEGDNEDQRWPPHVNQLYEHFLNEERKFVTEGQWEKFPYGSRLFIGNLPTEKVTKRDIFHRFYQHGTLAQISIKQAYGFVQFMDAESCRKAIDKEQGQMVRGRKMHLEVSKPQRNTKKIEPERNAPAPRRRSPTPDFARRGSGHYGRNPISPRDRDNRRPRDNYRRSPSPRGRYRGRDRSRDRYDDRRRSRTRSRSPRRRRSSSPRRGRSDELPLPFRAPNDIPDVQVLVLNETLPRDFIRWVEETFRRASLRIDVLIMSPRLDESAVVQRQIVEGVLAVVRLDSAALAKGKIDIQIFNRQHGVHNVQFNNYVDLDPNTAAALVIAAKQNTNQPVQPPVHNAYGQGYHAPRPPYMPPVPGNVTHTPNLSSMITSLDQNSLSQLLGAISGNNAVPGPQPPTGLTPDLARLLSQVTTSAPGAPFNLPALPNQPYINPFQPPYNGQSQQPPAGHNAGLPGHPGQPGQPGQPDMNEIMAQLAQYQPQR